MDGLPRSVNARLFCVDTGRQAMFHWMGKMEFIHAKSVNVKIFIYGPTPEFTAVSFIPDPKIQGITAGCGSAIAVSKQITTKFANEQIQNVTAQTATKMFAGQATMNILPSTMTAALLYGGSQRGGSMLDGGPTAHCSSTPRHRGPANDCQNR